MQAFGLKTSSVLIRTLMGEFNTDHNNDSKHPLGEAEEKILDELGFHGKARRQFLGQMSAAGISLMALPYLTQNMFANAMETKIPLEPQALVNAIAVNLKINGEKYPLQIDSRMTLLDALRERLNLTGSKKGCDHGQCGACTVLIDGKRKLSCLTLSATCKDKEITTIEGLAQGADLHPVQAAFLKHDGFQCGYCTPGQICSAVSLLDEVKRGEVSYVTKNIKDQVTQLSDEEIRERMSGNICRCGAYNNIVQAIQEVHSGKAEMPRWEFATEEQLEASRTAE